MKVLAHLDPVVLERALLDELAETCPRAEPHAALVIVPNSRLAGHVERRLLERRPAWLGVEVAHFRAIAGRILAEAGVPEPRVLSPRLLEALVQRVLRRHEDNRWSAYLRRRPGALAHLTGSLKDLREAGLSVGEVIRGAGEDAGGRDLATLYGGLVEELDRVREAGWVDDAGLIGTAIPHAEAAAARRRGIWLHGAYELIGAHARLMEALDRGREIRVLLPYQADVPVGRFAGRFIGERDLTVESLAGIEKRLPLAALYDEAARPGSSRRPKIAYRSAQGAAAEIKGAVRAALAAVRDGCPPNEIVIAARSLTPYKAALDEVFEQEGLPWTGSLTQPLRNHPAIHDLVLLIAVLDEDFPRRPTAELLRSPRVHWERLSEPGEAPRGAVADRWSRAAGVVGGLHEWRDVLLEWAGRVHGRASSSREEAERAQAIATERTIDARRIAAALERVHARAELEESRTWSTHADALEALIESAFDLDDDIWNDVAGLLREMRALETIAGQTGPVRFGDMRRWFESAVDRTERMPHGADDGGIRVLDMMQMRGLTCRHLFLVGMNSGILPRPPRPDPILPDKLREALRRPDAPLPVKKEGLDEERLILSLTLGAATDGIELAWQRADEAGRARTPSLALRETARLSHGVPNLALAVEAAAWHPSHPTIALEWLRKRSGMLSAREERLLTALRSVGQPKELDGWYPDLESGLEMLRATESFAFGEERFDGRIGKTKLEQRPLAVSALEKLARCPLQFFFARVLRVQEFDEEAEPFALTPREIGLVTHELLERLYGKLRVEGCFEQPLADRVRRAGEILDEVWGEAWRPLEQRLSRRAPALWSTEEAKWKGALSRFLTDDLERIDANGWGAPAAEQRIDHELAFGENRSLHLVGRMDRSFGNGGGRVIGDYKTGRVAKLDDETAMLKGKRLQVPLYWMLTDTQAHVEILGVGPRHDPLEVEAAERILTFRGMETPQFEGFLETMRVLTELIVEGVFPFNDGTACDYCPYELACRHKHPPTAEREEHAKDGRDYADLSKKNKSKKPTLADVRSDA